MTLPKFFTTSSSPGDEPTFSMSLEVFPLRISNYAHLNIANRLSKNKSPPPLLQDVVGCLWDYVFKDGVRLCRRCNSNLTTKLDKQKNRQAIFYLFVLLNLSLLNSSQAGFGLGNCSHSNFNFLRSHSKHAIELKLNILQPKPEKQTTPPAFMQTDAVQVRKKCQHHPFRISRPVVTLAVSMTLFNDNEDLATQVVETKNPAIAKASAVQRFLPLISSYVK